MHKKILSVKIEILGISFLVLFALFFKPVTMEAIQLRSTQPNLTPVPKNVKFDFERWPYPLYDEVIARFYELTRKYPKLARMHNIGKSGEGRDLWVIEITNSETGPGDSKPAMWGDAGMHAGEVTGRPVMQYFVERLLASYGKDPVIKNLVNTRTFYVMPVMDADGGELVLTRHPAWPGYDPSQSRGKDLDGNGYITQMRVKDPDGKYYKSPIDPRVMLRVRDREGGSWNYIPTTYEEDNYYWYSGIPNMGWRHKGEEPKEFDDPLAPRDQRYSIYTEGQNFKELEPIVLRERANFNRNWSYDWRPNERGSGPYPFSLPEIRAVAEFMTRTHRNIFFHYNIHSGGAARNYIVRPPMNKLVTDMDYEDNNFYRRTASIYSAISGGCITNTNYDNPNLMTGMYGDTMHGFATDWAYEHCGIHILTPEIMAKQKDYNGDGFVTSYEILRWNDEEMDGRFFKDWTPYDHPVLGGVEIGGNRGMPPAYGEQLETVCRIHYDYLIHIAGLSPLLRIKDLKSERKHDGKYRVVATLKNEGFLSTYITRNALKIRRDYPIVSKIKVVGGTVTDGERASKIVGHILGPLAYIARWGQGADESTKIVEWMVKPTGSGPLSVTVEAWAHKAGRDKQTITIKK